MNPLLEVTDLYKSFKVPNGLFGLRKFDVLRGINLHVMAGEVVGLVGESGSGKTTLARAIMGMQRPDRGVVRFCGSDMTTLSRRDLRLRRREMSFVYQNPYLSLNPRLTVFALVAEPIRCNGIIPRDALHARVMDLLAQVGLDGKIAARCAGELSGGQAQRVAVARALALRPKLILLDEPTSALDISVQAQVLNLLRELKDNLDLGYLMISHNLDVIRYICDRVYVMEKGRIVEDGPVLEVMDNPQHPYTTALIAATPHL